MSYLSCCRYPFTSSSHLCDNSITSSYVVSSLTITGQGLVDIDCGSQNFLDSGYYIKGRIVNLKLENLTVRGGVSDNAAIPLAYFSFSY